MRKLVSGWHFLDCFSEKSVIVLAVIIEVFFNKRSFSFVDKRSGGKRSFLF